MSEHNEREAKIKDIAYKLWEEAGRPEGQEESFWHKAEAEYNHHQHKATDEPLQKAGEDSFPASDPVNHM